MHTLLHRHCGKLRIISIILLCASLWQLATAGWIQGKAVIAQLLLKRAWSQSLENPGPAKQQKDGINKPWPWADTWPVARLLVPKYHIEQIILAGDSGSSLAFGPGYALASARPNTAGTTLISAHRDTHFSFLKELKLNDTLYLQTVDKTVAYQVYKLKIVDSKTTRLQPGSDPASLVLVTCYPFDALTPGGSARYLVYAKKTGAANRASGIANPLKNKTHFHHYTSLLQVNFERHELDADTFVISHFRPLS